MTNVAKQQISVNCEKSKSSFMSIPIEDRRLVLKHGGLGLQNYWLDCWEIDPYGSRYVLMPDADLKSRNQRKYRKQLRELGLFMFEIRKDGKNYQLWLLNRHGSRVKSYWEDINGTNERGTQNTEHGTQNSDRGTQNSERGTQNAEIKPQTQSQGDIQERSVSFQNLLSKFLKSLSISERESFLDFGRKKASQLPHPPELPDKWIAANWEDLYRQFQVSDAGRKAKQEAIAAQYDWENDPRFDEWLRRAFYEGRAWVQENEAEREQRNAFLEWAQLTDPYKGRLY